MCDSTDLSGQQSKKRIFFSQRFYRIMASKKINALSDKIREELCLSNVSQNRQSFSDRICDDLCEEILQYLSLEDKLKFEGVSKQFQRTIFEKHYELTIDTYNGYYLYIEDIFIDMKSLKVLLKKCPNITSIEMIEMNETYTV